MLEKVLESCKYVVDDADDVKIDYSKADILSEEISLKCNSIHWLEESPFGILDFNVKDLCMLLLILQSMDFSYWGDPKWTIKTESGELNGYYAMLYSLIKEAKNNPKFLEPTYLENISKEELKRVLKGNVEIPLFEERYIHITTIGKIINKKMNGDFYSFIKNTNNDIELFDIIINSFDIFNDVSNYKGKKVYIFKLAQLLVSDLLHARKIKEHITIDYSHLIGCADYRIPQGLRSLEVLKYSDKLANIIDNNKEILKDSSYEVEIRASMLVVIDYIYEKLNKKIFRKDINDFLWLMSKDKSRKMLPHHLTRTTYY